MKIAFITPEFVTEPSYSGGLANYLGRITVALAERGHTVHVFTRSTTNEQIDFKGTTVHRVVPLWDRRLVLDHIDPLIPKPYYNPYQDLKAAWCLWRRWLQVHKATEFDISQVANVMAVGLFFRGLCQPPVVTRMSSYRPFWDTAAGIRMTSAVKLRWLMEKLAVTGTQHIYAPTHFVAGQVQKGYGISQIDVIETPFFVEEPESDMSIFEEHAQGKSYLLFFGRMTQMKGVHILAQALPALLERFEDMHVFFIGGHGPAPDYRPMPDYIHDQLRDYQHRITVLESLRHDKLYPFIKNAKAVVLPSLMDNLPNTCLEAMGIGKVVIATSGSCFEQVIEPNASGILVTPGDIEALSQGITQAWQMQDQDRRDMEREAQKSIARLHPDRAVPQLIQYYQQVLEKS
jgi:glycosyltransferase involved in cell wall biosynthesis